MFKESTTFENECETIKQERAAYPLTRPYGVLRFFDGLSAVFYYAGFVALAFVPFTEITLLQATCLFVISYTTAPSDLDMGERVIKGMAEDLAHIRACMTVIRKNSISDPS